MVIFFILPFLQWMTILSNLILLYHFNIIKLLTIKITKKKKGKKYEIFTYLRYQHEFVLLYKNYYLDFSIFTLSLLNVMVMPKNEEKYSVHKTNIFQFWVIYIHRVSGKNQCPLGLQNNWKEYETNTYMSCKKTSNLFQVFFDFSTKTTDRCTVWRKMIMFNL